MGRRPGLPGATEFTAEIYRAAAEDRWTALETLYGNQFYTLTLYTAGVAVECMFRAYRARIDPTFDSRHDLFKLERASKFALIVPAARLSEYGAALSALAVRWSNNHRYRSPAALRSWLKRLSLDRGITGDPVKENARRASAAAGVIVAIGVAQWNRS